MADRNASLYQSPLASRYSSKEMLYEFSDKNKYSLWRRLWIWLAESERALGFEISQSQIEQMKKHVSDIDLRAAAAEERVTRNDVTAHAKVFGQQCPEAAPIINLGATAFFISDNADLIIMRNSLDLLLPRLAAVIHYLKVFANQYKALPTLAFIHLQPTHLTTVGRRACLWIVDLLMDERALRRCRDDMRFLGIKGTVGTQLNILRLFNGDHEKVKKLDRKLAYLAGFEKLYLATGQTYSRKVEVELLGALSSLGTTLHKMCCDLRILAFRKIMEEPFEGQQLYKRFPNRSERCCSLARYLISVYASAAHTQATQWLEGTLDDSAIRRVITPEAFLCADAALSTLLTIVRGLVVYPKLIERHNAEELPFMATYNVVMAMVKLGADRDICEQKIRALTNWAGIKVKQFGQDPDLIERIKNDEFFAPIRHQIDVICSAKSFIGRAQEQVTEFLDEEVNPVLFPYGDKVMLY